MKIYGPMSLFLKFIAFGTDFMMEMFKKNWKLWIMMLYLLHLPIMAN